MCGQLVSDKILTCDPRRGRCVLGVESPTFNQGVCGSNPGSVISLGQKFTPNFLPQYIFCSYFNIMRQLNTRNGNINNLYKDGLLQ